MTANILLTAAAVWLLVLLVDVALLLGRRVRGEGLRPLLRRLLPLGVSLTVAALFTAGGLLHSDGWAWATLGIGLGVLFVLVAALLLAGYWNRHIAISATALAIFGAGGLWMVPAQRGVVKLGQMLTTVSLLQPLWLFLLLILPPALFLARRNLGLKRNQAVWLWLGVLPAIVLRPIAGVRALGRYMGLADSWRPWFVLGLRTALFALLVLALAEPMLTRAGDQATVIFVIDRSASVPEEPDPNRADVDRRELRVLNFIRKAVEQRGAEHDHDSAGVVTFGRNPRLDLAPSDVPDLSGFMKLPEAPDKSATDIGKAIDQALASLLPDTNGRIVLLSDGNENLGSAIDVARKAQARGVQIDVVPLGANQRNEDEVLIEGIHTDRLARKTGKVEVNVLVRSYNPKMVLARLTLRETTDQEGGVKKEPIKPEDDPSVQVLYVALFRGLNPFPIQRTLTQQDRSYSYEARIDPLCVVEKEDQERVLKLLEERRKNPAAKPWVRDEAAARKDRESTRIVEKDNPGKPIVEGRVPRDRVQNNSAAAHIVARGRHRVLILEDRPRGKEDEVIHTTLVKKLEEANARGEKKFNVEVRPVSVLNRDPALIAAYLSNFDCIILANVGCDAVSEEAQEELRKNTHDHGCGLIMIGGENGFGAGGWQNTAVEKALPVDSDIKSLKVEGKGGLVLIMHACELAQGNVWEKKIARLALDRLGPRDEIGIIDFGGNGFNHNWVVKLQEVGANRAKILTAIDRMMPGDMPDIDQPLKMARDALSEEARGLSAKKVIFITDGDPQQNDPQILAELKKKAISVSTVIVVGHGADADKQRMNTIAKSTGGQYYFVDNPNKLPAIYIKESRMVSQAFIVEKKIPPVVTRREGPTKDLPPKVPDLRGFVRTTPKAVKNVIVSVRTPLVDGQEFPLLAYWDYGLGKAAAFTSDADRPKKWSQEWVDGGVYAKFWEQVVEWCMRPTESDRVRMKTTVRDGRILIRLEAEDEDKQPDSRLRVTGRFSVTAGAGGAETDKKRELRFVQREAGVYEAEIRSDESGTFFITAQVTRKVKRDGKEVDEIEVVRGAETLPLAPEYTVMTTNTSLLKRIAELTGGKVYDDTDDALREAAAQKTVFRSFDRPVQARLPLWYWLVFAAGFVLLLDVGARRIAIDSHKIRAWCIRSWLRLRGQAVPEPEREVMADRLQARRPADQTRAARRFEAGPSPAGPLPTAADAAAPQTQAPSQSTAQQPARPAESPEDVMSRLARAKKKIMDERKKDK